MTDLHREVSCPFCNEKGFDLVGLAYHLDAFPCAELLEARAFKIRTTKEQPQPRSEQ